MQPAGVRPDISERVLAHAIRGVEGVYDRHGYLPEKFDALTKLDALVDRILACCRCPRSRKLRAGARWRD
jgi:hypothetical protein